MGTRQGDPRQVSGFASRYDGGDFARPKDPRIVASHDQDDATPPTIREAEMRAQRDMKIRGARLRSYYQRTGKYEELSQLAELRPNKVQAA